MPDFPSHFPVFKALEEGYVFVSHSSQDEVIKSAVKLAFRDLPLKAHLMEDKPVGVAPSEEIANAVKGAKGLFVFFTSNSIIGETRDWIVFEIGVAVAHDVRIFSWKERSLNKGQLPRLLEQVSTYREFATYPEVNVLKLTDEIRTTVQSL